ncbi:MAG: DNA translocase FtsK [Defluviitaleaceae bacterium]|nr:DNA translocase FtsK [Defluviitaleaceae bacterium]
MPRRKSVPSNAPEKTHEKKPAVQNEVTYLVVGAVGILILLLIGAYIFTEEPAVAVRIFAGLLFGLFGVGGFLLPVGILAFAVCRLAVREFRPPIVKMFAFFWMVLALLHIFFDFAPEPDSFVFFAVFSAGLDSGGGVFGLIIGGPLVGLTNAYIAVFVLIAASIILAVLITGRSFVSFVGTGVKKARDFYEETKQEDTFFEEEWDERDRGFEPELPPLSPLMPRPSYVSPPAPGAKKGNFVDIENDDTAAPPPKIRLINEELDESFSQRKPRARKRQQSLFDPRPDYGNTTAQASTLTFPAVLPDVFPDEQDFPPWEEGASYENDMYLEDAYESEYEVAYEGEHEGAYEVADLYEATQEAEEYYEDEPVVLPLDVHVYGEEPLVRGLVEGAAASTAPTFESEDDEDDEPQSSPPLETYEDFNLPEMSFLTKNDRPAISAESRTQVLENSRILEETLRSFKIEARVIEVSVGPTVTRYDLAPGAGVKVASITNLNNDLALALAAQGLRIEAPVPGRSAIGIEIPNKDPQGVFLREIVEDERFINFPSKLAFAVGKDIAGSPVITDVARMPHLLIAGATGSGKSVCINTLIVSILYKARPDEVKLLMIDPKVVELSVYNGIPHLLIPVVTDPKKAAGALSWAVAEMEQRYALFAEAGCRDIKSYNVAAAESLPLIVVIIDELADLMMSCKGEVEESICRLAQKARAAGIHLIVATQRPSVDVITGLIKANIPSRLAFAVSSGIDSRTVLDMYGAEKLLGRGDMLFMPMGQNKPLRVQGGFISEGEVESIVNFLKAQAPVEHTQEEIQRVTMPGKKVIEGEVDEFFHDAVDFLISKGKGSTSILQRQFRIGYNRASRLMEDLHARGIVGPEDGVKPRKVTITREEYRELYGDVQN